MAKRRFSAEVRVGRGQRGEVRLHPAVVGPIGGEVSARKGGKMPPGERREGERRFKI